MVWGPAHVNNRTYRRRFECLKRAWSYPITPVQQATLREARAFLPDTWQQLLLDYKRDDFAGCVFGISPIQQLATYFQNRISGETRNVKFIFHKMSEEVVTGNLANLVHQEIPRSQFANYFAPAAISGGQYLCGQQLDLQSVGTAACTRCRLVTSSAARPVGFQQFLSEVSPTFASASVLAFSAPMNEELPIYLDRAAALEMIELADASRTAGDSFSILETMGNQ